MRNVFGKKRAKEECARLTLEYLTRLREDREEMARRLMAGFGGFKGVPRAAAGEGVVEGGSRGMWGVRMMTRMFLRMLWISEDTRVRGCGFQAFLASLTGAFACIAGSLVERVCTWSDRW